MNCRHNKVLFWGCFVALVTTSYAFINRMILSGGRFATDFGQDKVTVGELQGAGIWPFGVSIILFSLFIDRIGYKVAMAFSFVCYLIYTALAVVGLAALSKTNGASLAVIFAAATLYGIGKTFFWPTMLGLTPEQYPKGGALTLDAMGGIGMLTVGILGFPFIGYLQESSATAQLQTANPALYQSATKEGKYLLSRYRAIDPDKAAALADDVAKETIKTAKTTGQFSALGKMAMFPAFMLAGYVALILYFKAKGGYKPVELSPTQISPPKG